MTSFPRLALVAALATTLAACGGGGGDGDAGTVVPPATLDSYALGTLHGLEPVRVNGQAYETAGASVQGDNGAATTADALALGMVVEVQAGAVTAGANGTATARATQLRWRSEIEGPVQAVDTVAGSLTVLGQRVSVTPATVFQDELRGGLAQVRVGDVLEVYGFVDAAGAYQATRLEREDDRDPYKLRGPVAALDTAAQSFRIGTLTISYAALPAAATLLAPGSVVRVELQAAPDAAGRWAATRIDSLSATASQPAGRVQAEVEGVVTDFTSSAAFQVGGVRVDASRATGVPAGLAAGVRVEVEGQLADGVLVASSVELDDPRDTDEGFELGGRIESLDPAAQRFMLRGVAVDYAAARFEGGTVARLAVGVRVDVDGTLSGDGSTLRAREVEFD